MRFAMSGISYGLNIRLQCTRQNLRDDSRRVARLAVKRLTSWRSVLDRVRRIRRNTGVSSSYSAGGKEL